MKQSIIVSIVGITLASPLLASGYELPGLELRNSANDSLKFTYTSTETDRFGSRTTTLSYDPSQNAHESLSDKHTELSIVRRLAISQTMLVNIESLMDLWRKNPEPAEEFCRVMTSQRRIVSDLEKELAQLRKDNPSLLNSKAHPLRTEAYKAHTLITGQLQRLKTSYPELFAEDKHQIHMDIYGLLQIASCNVVIAERAMKDGDQKLAREYLAHTADALQAISTSESQKSLIAGLPYEEGSQARVEEEAFLNYYIEMMEAIGRATVGIQLGLDAANKELEAASAPTRSERFRALLQRHREKDNEDIWQATFDEIHGEIKAMNKYYKNRSKERTKTKCPVSADQIRVETFQDRDNSSFVKLLDSLLANYETTLKRTPTKLDLHVIFVFSLIKIQLDKAKKEFPFLFEKPVEKQDFTEPKELTDLLPGIEAVVGLYKEGKQDVREQCILYLRDTGKQLMRITYVQHVLASMQFSEPINTKVMSEKEALFCRRILTTVEEIQKICVAEKISIPARKTSKKQSLTRPQRSDSMDGIRVKALPSNDDGIRVRSMDTSDDSKHATSAARETTEEFFRMPTEIPGVAKYKKDQVDEALLKGIGLKFKSYKPQRDLLELLGDLQDYVTMLPTLLYDTEDKTALPRCIQNTHRVRELVLSHPYSIDEMKKGFHTDAGSQARKEESIFRLKIVSILQQIQEALNFVESAALNM
jgi:hypothetical protein